MLRAEELETMLYGCVTWSPHACHYDTLRRTHHSFLTRSIGWRTDHSLSYLDTLIKTGSSSIKAIMRGRRILFAGVVARMEAETAEMRDVRRTNGGRGLRNQRRPVDDCSPGREGMAPDGGNKGGNVSWRNGSLRRKSMLDCGMQY